MKALDEYFLMVVFTLLLNRVDVVFFRFSVLFEQTDTGLSYTNRTVAFFTVHVNIKLQEHNLFSNNVRHY